MESASNDALKRYRSGADEYQRTHHSGPVMDAVALMPKDELAVMAETLVNLTSFKRKVTLTPETVGGPIDVAVISKGDGFVWITRKHYFRAELNPRFLARYYPRTGGTDGQDHAAN